VRRGVEDRRRRLDREADDDRLAGRDAAQDAAGVVRQEHRLAVAPMRISSAFSSPRGCRAKAGADLDALDGVDRHHRRGDVLVELAVDRRAEAGGTPSATPRPRRRSRSRACGRRR
jgi:hypothetical protein